MPWTCTALMSWIDPGLCRTVDHYCERAAEGWSAEPFNALSNLAFLIAGWAAWRLLARGQYHGDGRLLVVTVSLIPAIGLGSMFFHTLAIRWAEWLDVLPILIFMILYLWLALEHFLNMPTALKLLVICLFFLATFALEAFVPGTFLGGGAMYLPAVSALGALALATKARSRHISQTFAIAVGVFLVSFVLRTIDGSVCSFLPTGTHIFWHLLNAGLIYFLIRSVIVESASVRADVIPS